MKFNTFTSSTYLLRALLFTVKFNSIFCVLSTWSKRVGWQLFCFCCISSWLVCHEKAYSFSDIGIGKIVSNPGVVLTSSSSRKEVCLKNTSEFKTLKENYMKNIPLDNYAFSFWSICYHVCYQLVPIYIYCGVTLDVVIVLCWSVTMVLQAAKCE